MAKRGTTKYQSTKQEKRVAKDLDAKVIKIKDKEVLVDEEDYIELSQYNWYIDTNGRVQRNRLKGESYSSSHIQMHRQIMKATKGDIIDHINRNPLDNRKANLRFCTQNENERNKGKKSIKNATSKYKGVRFKKGRNKCWECRVKYNGKELYLGSFYTEEECALRYNEFAIQHYGEFAVLNEVNIND